MISQAELEHAYNKVTKDYWEVRNAGGDYNYLEGMRTGFYLALHPDDGSNLSTIIFSDFKEEA